MEESRKYKRKQFSKAFRQLIFERDNYECQRCFTNLINKPEERVIDHKIPLSKGGSNALPNLWLLCNPCDKRKKDDIEADLANEYIKSKLKLSSKKSKFNADDFNDNKEV